MLSVQPNGLRIIMQKGLWLGASLHIIRKEGGVGGILRIDFVPAFLTDLVISFKDSIAVCLIWLLNSYTMFSIVSTS